jgi:hypothetical protein
LPSTFPLIPGTDVALLYCHSAQFDQPAGRDGVVWYDATHSG